VVHPTFDRREWPVGKDDVVAERHPAFGRDFMAQDHEESSPSPGKFGQPGMKRAVISTEASVAKHPRTANLAPLYPASA
jgi:hypothetical protein